MRTRHPGVEWHTSRALLRARSAAAAGDAEGAEATYNSLADWLDDRGREAEVEGVLEEAARMRFRLHSVGAAARGLAGPFHSREERATARALKDAFGLSQAPVLADAMRRFDAGARFDLLGLNALGWKRIREEAEALDSPRARAEAFRWARSIADRLARDMRSASLRAFMRGLARLWFGNGGERHWLEDRERLRGAFADSTDPGGAHHLSLQRRVASIEDALVDVEVKRLNRRFGLGALAFFGLLLAAMFREGPQGACGPGSAAVLLPPAAFAAVGLALTLPRLFDQLVPSSARTLWHEPCVRLLVGLFALSFLAVLWAAAGVVTAAVAPACSLDPATGALIGGAAAAGGASSKALHRWGPHRTTRDEGLLVIATWLLLTGAVGHRFASVSAFSGGTEGLRAFAGAAAGGGFSAASALAAAVILVALFLSARHGARVRAAVQALVDDLAVGLAAPGADPNGLWLHHVQGTFPRPGASSRALATVLTPVLSRPRRRLRRGGGRAPSRLFELADGPSGRLVVAVEPGRVRVRREASLTFRARPASARRPTPWARAEADATVWKQELSERRARGERLEPPPAEHRSLPSFRALRRLLLHDASARRDFLAVRWRGKPVGVGLLAELLVAGSLRPDPEADAGYLEALLDEMGARGPPSAEGGVVWALEPPLEVERRVERDGVIVYSASPRQGAEVAPEKLRSPPARPF